ncbi:hypothetical protein Lal_00027577 [Lupinus albus]|uniref:Putative survival motor neuron n=1 Tax=Lupinus albus TaxID=3870 RepID=A0A6A5MKW3_LUPAL|nr:putative survival motor neuron [Lupinus albus]KAF1873539.1 hypothetical protein Lal_00027577 [Lupinus albus]
MGKEGDLWDDSALINAFDHAISTYKKMHSIKNKDGSADPVRVIDSSTGKNESNVESPNIHTTRDVNEKSNIPATDATDSGGNSYVSKLEENHVAESQQVDQPFLDSTSGQDIHNAHDGYAYAQGADDYNQLVAQYYELEEKRLKVLEQLNQYGGSNYQYQYAADASGSGVPYSNSQDYSMSTYQVSDPNVVCTCCPCYSQCLPATCTSVPGCSLGGSCVGRPHDHHSVEMDHKMLFPRDNDKIRKMAMGAAKKALSNIKSTISGDSNVNEEKERNKSELEEINGSETDLTAVLNAWYSAGFYTGKYLVEQSIASRREK